MNSLIEEVAKKYQKDFRSLPKTPHLSKNNKTLSQYNLIDTKYTSESDRVINNFKDSTSVDITSHFNTLSERKT